MIRPNPYKQHEAADKEIKEADYIIRFVSSDKSESIWYFKTLEAAQQTLEWLDQLYGVQFIPSQILETENKEND